MTAFAAMPVAPRAPKTRPHRGVKITPAIQQRIAFYGGLCWICGVTPYQAIDHVKPVAAGGSSLPANLRPVCTSCNSRKGSRWPYARQVA